MYKYFENALVVNEGIKEVLNILVKDDRIEKISKSPLSDLPFNTTYIDCKDLILLPGVIDAHVHFRQPGLENKADMHSESMAAVAGGVTTVLEMPNTNPATTNKEALKEKIRLAKENMLCNYGFFLGLTNNNFPQIQNEIEKEDYCGLKLFLGSSTGNMLVDKREILEEIFEKANKIISAHCEDEKIIKENTAFYKEKYEGKATPANIHSLIRTSEACFNSTAFAIELAKKFNTKLHIAHISTKEELDLLTAGDLRNKRITAEVSPNHLWFSEEDFEKYGNLIKCNPSIKTKADRDALRKALNEDKIDIIATDHAPHRLEEKQKPYFEAPSGIPSIQHSLLMMLELVNQEILTIEKLVEKISHNPATLFEIKNRGFIRENYFADFVLIDSKQKTTVLKENIYYKCKWSAIENFTFSNKVISTYINGKKVYENGNFFYEKNK
ncbi:MAG: dihydroorotase [Bacteroidales bacterium]|nr:dihydroorotase [Bacteroidales bacterium]